MNEMNAAQRLWFESVLRSVLQSETPPVSLDVRSQPGEEPSKRVIRDSDAEQFVLHETGQPDVHLSPDAVMEHCLNSLSSESPILFVDDGARPVLHRMEKGKVVRETVSIETVPLKTAEWAIGKSTHLHPQQAAPLLQSIGLMTPEGEIRAPMRKKFKQVNHFLELLTPILKTFGKNDLVTLVDCGCGKSYLGLSLYWYLRNVLRQKSRLFGVDGSRHVIQRCREQAREIGLADTTFVTSSIQEFDPPNDVSLIVSLHACDTATDEALAVGVAARAKHILAVPCCQQELSRQIQGVPEYPIPEHRLFTHRFADLLTDMTRSLFLEAQGYSVKVGEFVSHEDTPKNLMLRATRQDTPDPQRQIEYDAFKQHYGIYPSIDWMYQMRTSGTSE